MIGGMLSGGESSDRGGRVDDGVCGGGEWSGGCTGDSGGGGEGGRRGRGLEKAVLQELEGESEAVADLRQREEGLL